MKMIRAIVRPDAADVVTEGLAEAGFFTMTKINAFGRGQAEGHHRGGKSTTTNCQRPSS